MTVQVNGQPRSLPDRATVAALIVALGLAEKRVAVEVNRELVVKQAWETTFLKEDDRVEVVTFVGGG